MDHQLIFNMLVYLAAAVVAVPVFKKIGLGAILGYLAAGAVLGPQGLNFIDDPKDVLHFAEFGVVMLLFVIGIELNPQKLWSMRKDIAFLGLGQLLLSAAFLTLIIVLLSSLSLSLAILVALTLGLSSTAFAVQLMDEQQLMGTDLGRKGFSILLLQDMAVIPILLLASAMAPVALDAGGHGASAPWWLGGLAIVAVLIVGKFLINPLLKLVSQSGSKEVLTAAALLIVLSTAVLMQEVGFSMGMGAFLAGILLANSSFRHQLEADIEPFKGLLLGLFFIAVGMSLDLALFISKPLLILALACGLMLVKTVVIVGLLRFSRCSWKEGLLLGLLLSQGGEFAFVVMAKATGLDLLAPDLANQIVLVVGVSMALTSPLVSLLKILFKEKVEESQNYEVEPDGEPEVIIAGFGRFGQIVGRMLSANGIPFTAMDKDAKHVDFVKRFGNKLYYGDAKRLDLLEAAGIKQAKLLVVAIDEAETCTKLVHVVKTQFPDVEILARAHNRMHVYQLKAEKADYIVRETFDSSLIAAKNVLISLGYTESQAIHKAEIFKAHDEELIEKAAEHKDDMDELLKIAKQGRLELEQLFKQDKEF